MNTENNISEAGVMPVNTNSTKGGVNCGGFLAPLLSLLGESATLISMPHGSKAPVTKGWQNTEKLNYADPKVWSSFLNKNIAVVLGSKSGGLCAIDIDDDDAVEPFLRLNPLLRNTLITKGKRGCQIWVRVVDEYPKLSKLTTVNGEDWGEWRADGGLSIVAGKHPSGCWYQCLHKAVAISLVFEEIAWPLDLSLPWMNDMLLEEYDRLVERAGKPFTTEGGRIRLNQTFFALKFEIEHRLLWERGEKAFYLYKHERGLWELLSINALQNLINQDYTRAMKDFGDEDLAGLNTNAFLNNVVSMLKGMTEKDGIFKNEQKVVQMPNGMLCIKCEPPTLYSYHWDYYARNGCGIVFDPEADCPRFKTELLDTALDADDILLIQKCMGAILLGCNPTQSIIVIRGTPGGGKSTLVTIVELVIGMNNVVQLRTSNLGGVFETSRFLGKKLLCGKDVASDFLSNRTAGVLKSLVGGDFMTAEKKNSNEVLPFFGEFNMVITANSALQLRLDGDEDAWARRLIVIDYKKDKTERPIPNFAQKLLQEEGPGILNFMINGAISYLRDVEEHGTYALTPAQQGRIDDLVHNSDSLRHFVTGNLQRDADCDVTVSEMFEAYENFCIDNGWEEVAQAEFFKKIPKLMLEVYGLKKRHDIESGLGGFQRGFSGVRIIKRGK